MFPSIIHLASLRQINRRGSLLPSLVIVIAALVRVEQIRSDST